jgi:ribosomal protein L40E
LIVWSVALGGLFAAVVALSPAARAGTCDQVGGVITGDWTITTTQVCTGIVYSVDGSININAGGSLTLVNGGLSFAKDTSHEGYALNVNAGGELVLDNSIVTTQTDAISPFLKLAFTVSGANSRFTMKNGASLKFPGWFNATGATIDMTGSRITGFSSTELFGVGVYADDNDDSPVISWASTTASLYGSRIERVYENQSATGGGNSTGIIEANVTLTASSNLYAYDSYIGVDFSNVVGLHNALQVDGTSNAYLYGVTIDRSQDPVLKSTWQPAYVPLAAGGNVFLLRWLRASVVDSTGFPVSGASIWSTLSPSATTAQYPDNGLSSTPSARTLAYLGRAASGANAWNHTDSSGLAVIPLYTDVITTASLPNAESFGNYQLTVAFSTTTGPGGVDFDPYPAISADNNTKSVTVSLPIQVRTGPDLTVAPASPTMTVLQNQPFTVYALISNQGQTTATGVSVAAYLDGSRAVTYGRVDSLTVATSLNQTMTVQGVAAVGTHTLELIVDPDNTINEGGSAQESNNFANITLTVQPPPAGFTFIVTPANGQSVVSGSTLAVTGFVRDSGSSGIGGVVLTIELRSGATVLGTNSTMSASDGSFIGSVGVPQNTQDGSYTIVVTPGTTLIQPDTRTIAVQRSSSFLFQNVPILGIQWWLFLVILAAAAAVAIGVSLYWKVYGLGKMVECGECGAFIPEDATTCPKCGVEFERDMAKCSNCQAWIPVDVKQCPECGVEFATGQLEMADYKEKMRLQYDEVIARFKQEASRQLGRSLSETEFQEWWRKQPTFLTFEDWLREEEEMRKMGSKPCPTCGTLNSVTANVCHKCGSLMRDQRPPSGGAVVAGAPARRIQARGPMSPPGPSNAPAPIVQKRVIKKPIEGKEGESSEGQSGDENASSDDL